MTFRPDKVCIESRGEWARGCGFKSLDRLGLRSLTDAHPCEMGAVRPFTRFSLSSDSYRARRKFMEASGGSVLRPAADPFIRLGKPASADSISAHFAEPLFVKDPPLA